MMGPKIDYKMMRYEPESVWGKEYPDVQRISNYLTFKQCRRLVSNIKREFEKGMAAWMIKEYGDSNGI